jgi:hypothetical protein
MRARARSDRLVAVSGVVSQDGKCLVHVQVEAFGEFPFGLLDNDPAVQGGLQLLVEGFAALQGALVQRADGGHVGEGLTDRMPAGSKGVPLDYSIGR